METEAGDKEKEKEPEKPDEEKEKAEEPKVSDCFSILLLNENKM